MWAPLVSMLYRCTERWGNLSRVTWLLRDWSRAWMQDLNPAFMLLNTLQCLSVDHWWPKRRCFWMTRARSCCFCFQSVCIMPTYLVSKSWTEFLSKVSIFSLYKKCRYLNKDTHISVEFPTGLLQGSFTSSAHGEREQAVLSWAEAAHAGHIFLLTILAESLISTTYLKRQRIILPVVREIRETL